ncbi:flagellar basal body rod protein FlgG [Alkalibacillus aidingensis]|uniref:flagellar basal body rod protein FlgG n=1 Tax=Alkalibacillus aidingensis TaxID=2747607 RepID=UPI0016606AB9|nr:flagellar basal body rod protein FlgG [Alkalibacillus aidingensis]
MLRSMYTGISGMSGFQNKLDVVSNNISNVNTFGFKKGRQTFSDLMSQTTQGATGPVGDGQLGGRNPMQVGLGSSTGSIDNIHTQGNRQTTNRPLDLAIEGDGMFVVAERSWSAENLDEVANDLHDDDFDDLNDDEQSSVLNFISLEEDNVSYTRAGNFYLDDDGYIVNDDGEYLVGNYAENENAVNDEDLTDDTGRIRIPEGAQSFSVGGDGTVNFVDEEGQSRIAGQIMLANFSNPEGLEKAGGNNFNLTNNAGLMGLDEDGDPDGDVGYLFAPGEGGTGNVFAGALEMSNVDLAEEFTEMITSQRGFQANTRVITTSDEILQELVNLKR